MDDADLVEAALGGDDEAFCELVRRHQAGLRAWLAALVIEPEAVFDLAQEVFLTAHRKLAEFDHARELGPWLRGIARTAALAHNRAAARRARRERTAGELSAALAAERETPDDRRLPALRRCLDQLATGRPEIHRLLAGRYFDGASMPDLAAEAGVAEGALRVRLLRAREVLRRCIDGRLETET